MIWHSTPFSGQYHHLNKFSHRLEYCINSLFIAAVNAKTDAGSMGISFSMDVVSCDWPITRSKRATTFDIANSRTEDDYRDIWETNLQCEVGGKKEEAELREQEEAGPLAGDRERKRGKEWKNGRKK